ncbi:YybH family protein [Arthrobacter sp. MDT2-2]
MPTDQLTEDDVLRAAATVVEAFGATDTRRYFDCFTADATFVFHGEDQRLDSRPAYEELWARWLQDGWRVTECLSSNQRVQLLGGTAVFTHDVLTTTTTDDVSDTSRERETIVFHRVGDAVKAVHEHLSPVPPMISRK